MRVNVPVTNTGSRAGSEVVQCYVVPFDANVTRPLRELKAFAKVRLDPGATSNVELVLDDRSFAYWNPHASRWTVDPGRYDLHVGASSRHIAGVHTVHVVESE